MCGAVVPPPPLPLAVSTSPFPNGNETNHATNATTHKQNRTETISFLPVWNDRRKRDRRRGRSGGGEYEEAPPPHKLSSEHDPLPEALGVKVTWTRLPIYLRM